MSKERKTIAEKIVEVAGAVCVAAGVVALAASGAALKAMIEGGRYLKETVKRIFAGEPTAGEIVEAAKAEVRRQEPAAAEVVFLSQP